MSEVLSNLEESININKLKGACHVTVRNAFFANYAAALLMLKLQDLQGLMVINDHSHAMLTKFSPTMSDLNFWGRALFHSNDSEVKARMEKGEAALLHAKAVKITSARVQKMMKVPLTAPNTVAWNEAIASALLAANCFELKSSYFSNIMRVLYKWDGENNAAKQKAVSDSLFFLIQSDPSSKLIPHLRNLSNNVMTKPITRVGQKIVAIAKLKEDDGGAATSTGNVGSTNAIISAGSDTGNAGTSQAGCQPSTQDMEKTLGGLFKLVKMSSNQVTKKGRFTIRNGKLVKKKVKDFAPKKFTAPDFLKPKKETKEKNDAA